MNDSDVVALLQRKDNRPGKNARNEMLEPLLQDYKRDVTKNRSTYECIWVEFLKLHPDGYGSLVLRYTFKIILNLK